jgi:hypothetical protein
MDTMTHGAIHGMLIVGDETFYLSHLPTFMAPHDYQVLMRASLSKLDDFLVDRQTTGATVYTLKPNIPFMIPDLVSTDPATPPLRTFQGTIFRGNFFKGEGVVITSDVRVDIEAVLHLRQYTPAAEDDRLEYLIFGPDGSRFASRYIKKPPDFDQMLSVDNVDPELWCNPDAAIRVAVPERTRAAADRLKSGEEAVIEPSGRYTASVAEPCLPSMTLGRELYFEDGFLKDS